LLWSGDGRQSGSRGEGDRKGWYRAVLATLLDDSLEDLSGHILGQQGTEEMDLSGRVVREEQRLQRQLQPRR
jgi:hypothetical protein